MARPLVGTWNMALCGQLFWCEHAWWSFDAMHFQMPNPCCLLHGRPCCDGLIRRRCAKGI